MVMRVRPEKGVALLLAVAALHLMVGGVHQYAHNVADVQTTALQTLFIVVVATVAPWAAVYVAWRWNRRVGCGLFSVSMGAAFLFGFLLHFVIDGPDLHTNVPAAHRSVFLHSAWALALVEVIGFVVGALGVGAKPLLSSRLPGRSQ